MLVSEIAAPSLKKCDRLSRLYPNQRTEPYVLAKTPDFRERVFPLSLILATLKKSDA